MILLVYATNHNLVCIYYTASEITINGCICMERVTMLTHKIFFYNISISFYYINDLSEQNKIEPFNPLHSCCKTEFQSQYIVKKMMKFTG